MPIFLSKAVENMVLMVIWFYRRLISPILPAKCRFYPSCSHYGEIAIKWHGTAKGGRLLLQRLGRCHPLGGSGIDFVPIPLYKSTFYPVSINHDVSHETLWTKNSNRVELLLVCDTYIVGRGLYRDTFSYYANLNFLLKHT